MPVNSNPHNYVVLQQSKRSPKDRWSARVMLVAHEKFCDLFGYWNDVHVRMSSMAITLVVP